ncbi:hypothetical protein FKP32DRAFT_1607781 [Trametes sanguinea]|nr:hypothetical protein FKP32DRAFT_1607781 [Trametes sanguinea]
MIGMTGVRAAHYVHFARHAHNQYYGRIIDVTAPFAMGYNHCNKTAPCIDDKPMAEVILTPAAPANTPGTGDVVMTAPTTTTTTAAIKPQAPAPAASGESDNVSTPRNDTMED